MFNRKLSGITLSSAIGVGICSSFAVSAAETNQIIDENTNHEDDSVPEIYDEKVVEKSERY